MEINDLKSLAPANAVSRMPAGAIPAILNSRQVLGRVPPGASLPLVYWQSRGILHGVLRAAAAKNAVMGVGVRVRVGAEPTPKLAGVFRTFFDRVVRMSSELGFEGPLFIRVELPYFSGGNTEDLKPAHRMAFAAYDAGFTSFSLKLPQDPVIFNRLPDVLTDPLQLDLGVEFRHYVSGVDPAVLLRLLEKLEGIGIVPDVLRPLDGPQLSEEILPGVAVGEEWNGPLRPGADRRVGVVTMDALISGILRSVLSDDVRAKIRGYQERANTGMEEAYEQAMTEGLVAQAIDDRVEAGVYAEFAEALDRMGASGTGARLVVPKA
jgi:hypothetical protein